MDGHFVPNLSYGAPVIADWRKRTDFPFDTHLMISDPGRYLDDFVKAGCDVIIFHIEAVPDPAAAAPADPGRGLPGVAGAEPADAARGDRAVPGRGRRGPGHERDAGLRRPEVRRRRCSTRFARLRATPPGPADLDRRRDQADDRRAAVAAGVDAARRRLGRVPKPMATTRRPWPSWPRATRRGSE